MSIIPEQFLYNFYDHHHNEIHNEDDMWCLLRTSTDSQARRYMKLIDAVPDLQDEVSDLIYTILYNK